MNASTSVTSTFNNGDAFTHEESATDYDGTDTDGSELNKPLLIIGYGSIIIVTVIGNMMVIVAFCRYPRIRNIPTNTIIFSLAVADFLVGPFVLTVNLAWVFIGYWPFGELFCKLWSVLDYTVTCMSSFIIVLISFDRFLMVTKKHKYRIVWTRKLVGIVTITCWVVTTIIYTASAFSFGTGLVDYAEECELEAVYLVSATIGLLILEVAIPFPLIVILNIIVYYQIYQRSGNLNRLKTSLGVPSSTLRRNEATMKQNLNGPEGAEGEPSVIRTVSDILANTSPGAHAASTAVQDGGTDRHDRQNHHTAGNSKMLTPGLAPPPQPGPNQGQKNLTVFHQQHRQFARHRKVAITLFILVTTFLACWLPYEITSILQAKCGYEFCFSEITWEVVNGLLWSNSALIPILYGLTNPILRPHMLCLRCGGVGARVAPTSQNP